MTDLFSQPGTSRLSLIDMTMTHNNATLPLRFVELQVVEGWWCVFWENRWRLLSCELNNCLSTSYHINPTTVVQVSDLFRQPGTYSFKLMSMTMTRDATLPLQIMGSWCILWEKEWRQLPSELNSRLSTLYRTNPTTVVEVKDLFRQPGTYKFDLINMTVGQCAALALRYVESATAGCLERILGK